MSNVDEPANIKNTNTNIPAEAPIATSHHRLVLLPEMDYMLQSVFDDIARAKRRVLVECYIVKDDRLGRALGEALAGAAERGVEARLLFDPLGSHEADPAFFEGLRARGVIVQAYRRGGLVLGNSRFAPRDHSRIIVADDAAYTGGAAWADPWLPEAWGGEGWRDVCVRVEGPCVGDFVRAFEQRYLEAEGGPVTPRDIDTRDMYPDVRLVADTTERESLVYLCHRQAIARAKRRVWMANAYFFPSTPLLHDLYEAAARGVEVAIMLPHESDLPIMKRAALSEYGAWLDHGLALFEYKGRVMHSKFAVIDDDWCTIGTFNANPTSLALANEVNLFVVDPAFVARVASLFEVDREACVRVTRAMVDERSALDRAVDALANNAVTLVDATYGPTRDEEPPKST